MTIVAFDTLTTAETLTDAGIEETHAKAITAAMRDAVIEGVATSADIDRLEGKIAGLETKMTSEIGRLEDKMMSGIDRLEGKIAGLETKMTSEIAGLETKMTSEIAGLETKMTSEIGRLEDKMTSEIAGLEGKIGRLEDKMMSENTRIETATRADIASLETRISESKNHTILAVFGIAGLLFTALKLFL